MTKLAMVAKKLYLVPKFNADDAGENSVMLTKLAPVAKKMEW